MSDLILDNSKYSDSFVYLTFFKKLNYLCLLVWWSISISFNWKEKIKKTPCVYFWISPESFFSYCNFANWSFLLLIVIHLPFLHCQGSFVSKLREISYEQRNYFSSYDNYFSLKGISFSPFPFVASYPGLINFVFIFICYHIYLFNNNTF